MSLLKIVENQLHWLSKMAGNVDGNQFKHSLIVDDNKYLIVDKLWDILK